MIDATALPVPKSHAIDATDATIMLLPFHALTPIDTQRLTADTITDWLCNAKMLYLTTMKGTNLGMSLALRSAKLLAKQRH